MLTRKVNNKTFVERLCDTTESLFVPIFTKCDKLRCLEVHECFGESTENEIPQRNINASQRS